MAPRWGAEPRARNAAGELAIRDPIETRSTEPDVRAAVAAVLSGDRDAFRVIVDQESAALVRACVRVLGDFHEAQDVAQDAFLVAFRSLGTWRGDGPFGAWLARIAIRLALRRLRSRRTIAWAHPDRDSAEPPRDSGTTPTGSTDPLGLALDGERRRTVRTAMADLDEPYREVVALRFFGDLSIAEIAAVTGRPLSTVKTHLRRGLLRLRDAGDLERVER